eukprot:5140893-Amphidinium_carterae.1
MHSQWLSVDHTCSFGTSRGHLIGGHRVTLQHLGLLKEHSPSAQHCARHHLANHAASPSEKSATRALLQKSPVRSCTSVWHAAPLHPKQLNGAETCMNNCLRARFCEEDPDSAKVDHVRSCLGLQASPL